METENMGDKKYEIYSYEGINFTISKVGKRWHWQVSSGKMKYSKSGFAMSKETAINRAKNYIDRIKKTIF